ncbi:MAG: hypothetical protein HC800_22400 [Phormidesmis sp. RL_2_1]|nr:hypothetical protein [Phormidesmis sp. RL_2_1]
MTYSTPNNFSPTANAENAAPQPSTVENSKRSKQKLPSVPSGSSTFFVQLLLRRLLK